MGRNTIPVRLRYGTGLSRGGGISPRLIRDDVKLFGTLALDVSPCSRIKGGYETPSTEELGLSYGFRVRDLGLGLGLWDTFRRHGAIRRWCRTCSSSGAVGLARRST